MQNDIFSNSSNSSGLFGALNTPTFYTILSVEPTASRMMIREAYLRLKNMYQNGSDGLYGVVSAEDFAKQSAELEEAFAVLNDDNRRAQYDKSINLTVASDPSLNKPTHAPVNATTGVSWDTIQTNRSTLRVIRTRAIQSENQNAQDTFRNILADADIGDGTTLQKLRTAVGVSDIEIQERTKISLEYIRAMESNRFDRLPQVVFVKGFMRSYLKYLCIPSPEGIITAFAARLEAWQQGHKQ